MSPEKRVARALLLSVLVIHAVGAAGLIAVDADRVQLAVAITVVIGALPYVTFYFCSAFLILFHKNLLFGSVRARFASFRCESFVLLKSACV